MPHLIGLYRGHPNQAKNCQQSSLPPTNRHLISGQITKTFNKSRIQLKASACYPVKQSFPRIFPHFPQPTPSWWWLSVNVCGL